MKQKINVAVDLTEVKVHKQEIELEMPEVNKFYSNGKDDKIFNLGLELFAILIKYPNSEKPVSTYQLVHITYNSQKTNDFIPKDDCDSESWAKNTGCRLRKIAYRIMTDKSQFYHDSFKEISKEEFLEKRVMLLSKWEEYL